MRRAPALVIGQRAPRDTRWLARYIRNFLCPVSVLVVSIGVLHNLVLWQNSAFGILLRPGLRNRLPLAIERNRNANPKS